MQKNLFCHHQNAGKKTIPGVYDNIMFGSLKKSNDFFLLFYFTTHGYEQKVAPKSAIFETGFRVEILRKYPSK